MWMPLSFKREHLLAGLGVDLVTKSKSLAATVFTLNRRISPKEQIAVFPGQFFVVCIREAGKLKSEANHLTENPAAHQAKHTGTAEPHDSQPYWDLPCVPPPKPSSQNPRNQGDRIALADSQAVCRIPMPGLDSLAEKLLLPEPPLSVALPAPDDLPTALVSALAKAWTEAEQSVAETVGLEVYTDGSAVRLTPESTQEAAWAFIVMARKKDGTAAFRGWIAHKVALPTSPNYEPLNLLHSNTRKTDSFAAEAEALYRALRWSLQSPDIQSGCPVTIVSDAKTLVQALTGEWLVDARDFVSSAVLSPLHEALHMFAPCALRWQQAHVGCLFNELVDKIAAYAANQPGDSSKPFDLEERDRLNLPWVWMHFAQAFLSTAYVVDDKDMVIPRPPPMQGRDRTSWNVVNQHQGALMQMDITFSTFNVNSLKNWVCRPGEQESWSSRTELLQQQGRNQNVLFLQETRARVARQWVNHTWAGWTGAACRGQGGVEIWINKSQPFAMITREGQEVPVYLKPASVTVIEASSRILALRYADAEFQALLLCAHAPHEHTEDELREKFWERLGQVTRGYDGWPVLVGIDANARVGSCTDPHVGGFAADIENVNGAALHNWLRDAALCLPTTFHETLWRSENRKFTWKSRGQWCRIDYPAIPTAWKIGTCTAAIDELGIDSANEDHLAVTLRLQVEVHMPDAVSVKRPKQHFDRHAMMTLDGKATCNRLWTDLPQYLSADPWCLPVDQYVQEINGYFEQRLAKWFPRSRRTLHATWISDATWDLLFVSRSHRRAAYNAQQALKNGILRGCLMAWRFQTQTHPALQEPLPPDQGWIGHSLKTIAWHKHQAIKIRARLAAGLKADEAVHLDTLASKVRDDLSVPRSRSLWETLRKMLPKWRQRVKQQPLKMTASQGALARHFAHMETATIKPMEEVVQWHTQWTGTALTAASTNPTQEDLPTLFELERAIHHMRNKKQTAGLLVPEVFKGSPRAAAHAVYPLLVHAVCFHQEAL